MTDQPTRRDLLASAGVAGVAVAATGLATPHARGADVADGVAMPPANFKIKRNRIKQSVMGWCFNPMPTETLIKHCSAIGLAAIEGINAKYYPAAKKAGLEISLVSSHGFKKGPFSRANHEYCVTKLKASICLSVV